jgi:fatty-acyl-CoA synthase
MDRLAYELGLTRDILENTNLTIWDMFRRSVTRHPDRPAVRMGEEVWTYAELLDRARRSATALHELGVTKGTRVAFLFHSCPEWTVLHYALSRLGAVAVPINLAFQSHELRHAFDAAEPELVIAVESFRGADFTARLRAVDAAMVDGATEVPSLPSVRWVGLLPLDGAERPVPTHPSVSAVFGSPGTAALLPEPGAAEPWDAAYIVFTSGSTAFPKPALIAHRAFLGAATGFVHALDMRPEDSFLAMLPTFHVGGVTCVLSAPHLSGGCADLMGAFEPALALRTIEQCRSTVTVGFDTMYTKMTGADEFAATDVSSLRKSLLACTPSYIDKLRELWEFDLFATSYGSTESGTLAAIVPRWVDDYAIRSRTNGQPLPGVEFKIVDPDTGQPRPPGELGEICFRGWCRVLEYVGMPEENAAAIDDGFFRSGDYGLIDADGYLHFRGRYKQMVKTGGENVSEREVEVFLEQHLDDVDFAQVVGVPDPVWGEAVVAFVSTTGGLEFDSDRLRALCKGAIAGYKIPKLFIGMRAKDFPVLANGRPDKSALRRIAGEHHERLSAHAG